jgi:AmmeMemoRadiSam system protein A
MKIHHVMLLVPLAVQLALFPSAGNGDNRPLMTQRAPSATAPDQERVKEDGMSDMDKLTEEQGKYLLQEARKTIRQALSGEKPQKGDDADLPPVFNERRGTFVTLTIGGNLRGCIGHIIPQESLIDGIRVNAINAAFKDPRFRPLDREEWQRVKVEISILTDPKPVSYSDADDLLRKLRPGIDGVIIKKGYRQSTFLPQVWDQLPGKEEFLNHLCLKAGLDGSEWKKGLLEVSTYQVQAFEE